MDITNLDIENEVCCYRSCGQDPTVTLCWTNTDLPKQRGKMWPVCDQHVESILEYLSLRGITPIMKGFPPLIDKQESKTQTLKDNAMLKDAAFSGANCE